MRASGLLFALCLSGCFSDTGPTQNGGTSGSECDDGTLLCPCYGNGSCDEGLECYPAESVCLPDDCAGRQGEENCPCENGQCDGMLVCGSNDVCASEPAATSGSTTGTTSTSTSTSTGTTSSSGIETGTSAQTTDATGSQPTGVFLFFTPPGAGFATQDAGTASALREVANLLCAGPAPELGLGEACDESTALISISGMDAIATLNDRGMPFDVPVLSASNSSMVATSFAAMLAGDLIADLATAQVTNAGSNKDGADSFFTGSTTNGEFDDTASCDGWLGDDGPGTVGFRAFDPSLEPTNWLVGEQVPCGQPTQLLCACW